MAIDIDALIESELDALDLLIEKYEIPIDVFTECAKSFLMEPLYQEMLKTDGAFVIHTTAELNTLLIDALAKQERLSQAVPKIPKATVHCICVAYTVLCSHHFFKGDDVQNIVMLLMTMAMLRGSATGNSPDLIAQIHSSISLAQRRNLSRAGEKGVMVKLKPYAEIKTWALSEAKNMKDPDIEIARKLSAQLPKHLADVSRNPERLIYEALRARYKPD